MASFIPNPPLSSAAAPGSAPAPAALLAIWQETLGIPPAPGESASDAAADSSLDENFFEAGGTSLLAARLAARLQSQLGCAVTAADILAHPSVRQLARKLAGNAPGLDRAVSDRRAAMQRGAFAAPRRAR